MSTQPTLFDPRYKPAPLTPQERFEAWVAENPHIVDLFLKYAKEAHGQGFKHYGVGAIAERVRWHTRVQTKGDDFKMNNNWRPRMARLLVQRDPSLDGFFEFRKLTADKD